MNIDKKNIFLKNTKNINQYQTTKTPPQKSEDDYPERNNFIEHGKRIKSELKNCINKSNEILRNIPSRKGHYIEFSGQKDYKLEFNGLSDSRYKSYLLNFKCSEEIEKATVFLPKNKESFLLKKIDDYLSFKKASDEKQKNRYLMESLESISLANLESFWTSSKDSMPNEKIDWYELWILNENDNDEQLIKKRSNYIISQCNIVNIQISNNYIKFPDRLVFQVKANLSQLNLLIQNCDYISEIKKSNIPSSFFLNETNYDNKQWINDLLNRTEFHNSNSYVCLLDTGLNYHHSLIKPTIEKKTHIQAVYDAWGNDDKQGHGSLMAGVAIYKDLNEKLSGNSKIEVNHKIESIKILPNTGENNKDSYGYITQQAVAKAEISNPNVNRTLCMAITAPQSDEEQGTPTSWSAAIDSITSNSEENNNGLFLISAGNIHPRDFNCNDLLCNLKFSIEDPGQSWNAITVGAYTEKITLEDKAFINGNFSPVIKESCQLSPYSRTSNNWEKSLPIKPEILFEGGNIVTNGTDNDSCPDLSLLTTANNQNKIFDTIHGTSAATAQASYIAAQIYAAYPNIWAETVRALIIHSASWTQEMINKYADGDLTKKWKIKNLLKACGYGIPSLKKAIQCANNSVNLIIQDELTPYKKDKDNKVKTYMNYHKLPWPKSELKKLSSKDVKIKITLSYFVEPKPSQRGWKGKYSYPSCGLRFEFMHRDEDFAEFKKRINKLSRQEDPDYSNPKTQKWIIGTSNRNVGSIHSDYIENTAMDFFDSDQIAIYPVTGWWKSISKRKQYSKTIRYALIISLETKETETDLYTPIINQIKQRIPTTISHKKYVQQELF